MPSTYASTSSAKTPAGFRDGDNSREKAEENRETPPPISRHRLLGLDNRAPPCTHHSMPMIINILNSLAVLQVLALLAVLGVIPFAIWHRAPGKISREEIESGPEGVCR